MHPILARGGRLALYVGVWALVGVLLSGLLAGQAALTAAQSLALGLPLAITYGFFCLSSWYVSRSMPLSATRIVRLAVTAVTSAAMSSAAWLALARGWIEILSRRGTIFDASTIFGALDALLFGFGFLLYLLSLAVGYLLAAFEQSRDTERRGLEVQVLAREAELRSLRAQIDPHFLFNSLNSISALTVADPPAARRMCVLLAEFLRESLALDAEVRITLDRELALAARFLDIERVRFGDRLRVEMAPGDAGPLLVPPLILQPLVENAVTHGIAHVLAGGTVSISAVRSPATLTIAVENPCDAERPCATGTGVGLANVRARLRALHGDDARVSSAERDGTWRVEISLPAEAVAAPAGAPPRRTEGRT